MPPSASSIPPTLIVFDLETTGLEPESDEILEIGAVPILDGEVREDCAFHTLVDPDRLIPPESAAVHGITDDMVRGRPRIDVVLPELLRYCGPHPLVAQNAEFDISFLHVGCERLDLEPPAGEVIDTRFLSKQAWPGARKHNLDDIAYRLSLDVGTRHRSVDDAKLTAHAYLLLREKLESR